MVDQPTDSGLEFAVHFDEGEWRTLQLAPVWAYQAVAEADGEIAELEAVSLGRALMDIAHSEGASELVRRVFTTAGHDLASLVQAWHGDPRTFDDGLRDAAAILADKAPGSEAAAFRRAVLDVAARVAGAVGGVAPEESLAIGMIAAALGAEQQPAEAPSPAAGAPARVEAPRPVEMPPVAAPARAGETDAFIATWGQTIGGWLRGTAVVVLVVYLLVAWTQGTRAATGPVDRDLFLASTSIEYLAPGIGYLLAPLLLLIAGPWAMQLRRSWLSRAGREAGQTFRYERRMLGGARTLYRRDRYGLRVAFQIALWTIGLVLLVGAIVSFVQDRTDATWNIGGYVAVGLTAAGLVGALLMLPRRGVIRVRVDPDGHVRRIGD